MNKKILLCISLVLAMLIGVFGIVSSASNEATVSVYKLVDYETDTQVDLKYYEFIGNASNNGSALENAAAMISQSGATGGLIDVSEGTLTVTNRQDISAANIVIKGAGKDKTTVVGNADIFNNTTNGLKSSSLKTEYKAILGLHGANIKVMDITISGGDCGYLSNIFSAADFKTVRINSGISYLERVDILGLNGRTNLMIGTSTTTSTVYTRDVFVEDPTVRFYGPTEIVNGCTVDFADSYLGGFVVGSTDSLGEGYYKLTYGSVTAYTTIPYAISSYESDDFASLMGAVLASETEQGVTVAGAMTNDLTTVLANNTTLLYGKDCDGMRALAWNFRDALASLSADTKVDVSTLVAKLDSALEKDSWHCVVTDGVCKACGASGLNDDITVETPSLDEILPEDTTEEDKNTVKNIVADVVANKSVAKVENTGLTDAENAAVVTAAKKALVELGVTEEVAAAVAPVVSIKVAEVVLADDKTPAKITYNVSPNVAAGDKSVKISAFEKAITFRLPIHSEETKPYANVYHNDNFVGNYPILTTDNGDKYVEVSAKNFSLYAVEPVAESTVYVAQIGDVKYATLAEAFANVNSGETVVLLANVSVDTETYTINDGKSIVLDMNGKKITATETKQGTTSLANFELFYNYGELTVTGNGTIELTATYNREWNAASSIFHNRGGILTIENGTFKHLGGTDMAYVVDNSGNYFGDATTNINGGTLYSTYTAIRNRMEQNSHGASGTTYLNINGGTIEGGSRAVWSQAASTSTTSPATGAINVTGGEVGLIYTAYKAGSESMTTISGGTVEKFKGKVGELTVSGGEITGEVEILTPAGDAADFIINDEGTYVAPVAMLGDVKYATLAEAIAAANIGDVIAIIGDVDLDAAVAKEGTRLGKNADGTKLLVTDAALLTFKGGSLRYQLYDGTAKGTDNVDLRMSYVFSKDFAFAAGSWGWNYKLGDSEVYEKLGENYDNTGRTNLVFTNVSFENFDKTIATQLWFKVTADGVEYTVYDAYQQRTALQVVDGTAKIAAPEYADAKAYATEVLNNYNVYLGKED